MRRCVISMIPVPHFDYLFLASAFDLLRIPTLRTANFVDVIPELADIDKRILSRIDIDG